MATEPTLRMLPSAYKTGKVYSVVPINGDGDLSFARQSTSTTINKDGLLQVINADTPRLNHIDGGCPSLLLEPARNNYVEFSERPLQWTYQEFGSGSAGTLTFGETDLLDGTNAVKIDFPSDAEDVSIFFGSDTSDLTSRDCTISIYVKLVSVGNKNLQLKAGFSGIVNINSTEFTRVSVSGVKSSNEAFQLKLNPSEGTSVGGFSIIVCHPQEEENFYATSYIPTTGSKVLRLSETCFKDGLGSYINNSEGVLYVDVSALANVASGYYETGDRRISLNNFSSQNRVELGFTNVENEVIALVSSSFVTITLYGQSQDILNGVKIALKYKQNDFALWINGVKVDSITTGNTPSGMNRVEFAGGNGNNLFYGNTNELRIYNSALSDAELAELTSL